MKERRRPQIEEVGRIETVTEIIKKRSRTTILIDKELWRKFRIKAMEEGKPASTLLEELIKKKLSGKK